MFVMSITRLIIATMRVQKRNRVSQVMYIGITSLVLRKAKKILASSNMGKQPPIVSEGALRVLEVPKIFYHKGL